MAKIQVHNYVFKPGIGLLDNLYPNAWNLFTKNKNFLLSEYKEYLNSQIADAEINRRDTDLIIAKAGFDISLNTNYHSVFFKNTRNHLIVHNTTVNRNNTRVRDKVLSLTDVDTNTDAVSRVTSYFNTISNIILNGKDGLDSVTFVNPSSAPAENIAAKDQLIANKNFIAEEVNAYVAVNNPNDEHDAEACKKDIKFTINALAYDVLYGGSSGVNSATFDLAKHCFYNFDNNSASILPIYRNASVAAFTRFKAIIEDIVKGVSVTTTTTGHSATQDTSSDATSEVISSYLVTLVDYIKNIIATTDTSSATIALNTINRTEPTVSLWASTELQASKTAIDNSKTNILDTALWTSDYVYANTDIDTKLTDAIDAMQFNFRYGGNASIVEFVKKYWIKTVSQISGNRVPESDVYSWLGETVSNNILTNIAYNHTGNVSQTIDTSYTAETNSATTLLGYTQNITDTIYNGLGSLPTSIADGVGYITFADNYNIKDFLIITNLQDNSVIYSFTNNNTGGKIIQSTPLVDIDFPNFVSNSDTITKLQLNYNTSTQSATDKLQIFIENTENNESVLVTTPSGVGKDLIGKNRVSQVTTLHQSDFEYGMQESRWSNFSLQNSYPSIYELSQIPVKLSSITTDISVGTNKIGSSLITITTVNPHMLQIGDAINVSELSNSISNTEAAEGTFIVNAVESDVKFNYYAKNTVGTDTEANNVLSYPNDFSIVSDTGFLYVANQTQWSRTVIPGTPTIYNTIIKYNNVTVINTNDDSYFQQGFYQTGNDRYSYGTVISTTADTTIYQLKKQVLSSYLDISTPQSIVKKSAYITGGKIENISVAVDSEGTETNNQTNLIVQENSKHIPFENSIPTLGSPANVYYAANQLNSTINTTSGSNTITTTDTTNFTVGAQISATGLPEPTYIQTVGVTGPNYNITLTTLATATGSGIAAVITPKTYIGQVTSLQATGTEGGTYTTPILTKDSNIGDTFLTCADTSVIMPDLAIDRGDGKAVFVQSIEGNKVHLTGQLTSSLTGNEVEYTNIKGTNVQHSGNGANFDIAASGTNYSITINTAGQNYSIGDRLKILGTSVGGLTPTNDLIIIVAAVNGSGGITSATPVGVPFDGSATITNVAGTVSGSVGSNATFNVTYLDNSYTNIDINQNGTGYIVGDKILISGTSFTGGSVYINDLILTVTSVNGTGGITNVTSTGTAPNASVIFSNPVYSTAGSGVITSFSVQSTSGVYSVTFDSSTNFNIADTIIIQGSQLGGVDSTNNLTISVNTVDATGSILTFSTLGSGINGTTVNGKAGTNLTGSGSNFTVSLNGGLYTNVNITNAGSNFAIGQTIKILGSTLMGTTPANDLLVTVTSINSSRELTGVQVQSGTAITAIDQYNTVSTVNDPVIGVGAKFTVTRNATTYSVTAVRGGANYAVGNKIKISGAHLGGSTPAHDLVVRILSVDTSGGIVINSSTALDLTYSAVPTGSTVNLLKTFTISTPLITELPSNSIVTFDKLTTLIGTTETPHGLVPGNSIINFAKSHTSSNKHNLSSISTNIHSVPTDKTFKFFARTTGTIDESLTFPDQTTTRYDSNTDFWKESVVNFGGSTTNQIEIKWDGATILLVNQLQNNTVYNGIINDNYEYTTNGIKYKRGSSQVVGASQTEYQVQQIVPVKTFGDGINPQMFIKNNSTFSHKTGSGAIAITTGGPEFGSQAIRQTKEYFQYQPGKSMFFNTAVLFAPNYTVQSMTASATTINSDITITIDERMHGLQKGAIIRISGVDTIGYNSGPDVGVDNTSDYKVVDIVDDKTLIVKSVKPLESVTPTINFNTKISVVKWSGSSVRCGIYTEHDGVFWEYNGNKLAIGLRTSTNVLTGTVNFNKRTNTLTGTNTKFTDQLCAGDRIVIKGMTHTVSAVSSDTEFHVTPQWRGVNDIVKEKIYKVTDHKVTQDNFNIDKLDGSGPSGYSVDVTQMQMVAIQHSWNGVGSIEYLIQAVDGSYITVHRIRNNNIKNDVYMRTANLPVRYETINIGAQSKLQSNITNNQTSIVLNDSTEFPAEGIVLIDNELIEYRSNNTTTNTLSGCIRAADLKYYHAGSLRAYAGSVATLHNAKTGVRCISQTAHPVVNHWTSNYQVDGHNEIDNNNSFSYTTTQQEITQNKASKFMLRLAPSLSNNLVGDIGERDLINHTQIKLDSVEIETHSLHTKKSGEVILTDAASGTNAQPGYVEMRNAHNLNINEAIRFLTTDGSAATMGNIKTDGTIYFVKRIINTTQIAIGLSYASPTVMTQTSATGASTGFLTWESVPEYTDNIIIEGVLNPYNYPEVDDKIAWTDLNGIPEGKQKSVAQIAFGENIDWKSNIISAGTVNVATAADALTTGAGSAGFVYTTVQSTNNSPIAIASSQIRSLGPIPIGAKIISQNPDAFSNSTTPGLMRPAFYVKYITTDSDNTYLHYENEDSSINKGISKQILDHTSTPPTTFKFEYDNYTGKRTNKLLFLKAAWDTGGRKVGDRISSADLNWPIDTKISSVTLLKMKDIEFYEVTFNQDSIIPFPSAGEIVFDTGGINCANGGQIIFQGTTVPGKKLHLDLSDCDVLVNSPIGSNKTYPNGPDTLVINTYKPVGNTVLANITLNWKEI